MQKVGDGSSIKQFTSAKALDASFVKPLYPAPPRS